jgi:hypothetical protein
MGGALDSLPPPGPVLALLPLTSATVIRIGQIFRGMVVPAIEDSNALKLERCRGLVAERDRDTDGQSQHSEEDADAGGGSGSTHSPCRLAVLTWSRGRSARDKFDR